MSKAANNIVYSSFIIIFGIFIGLLTILFSTFTGPSYDWEMFITAPGLYATEWIFSLWMIPVMTVLIVLISGYFTLYLYIHLFIKITSKRSTIGIVQAEEVSSRNIWIKIFGRSLILALFTMNISYMLSSESFIVDIIRVDLPASSLTLPDPLTMYGILYLVIIPCAILLVPIWISNDIGLISSKKIRGKEINDVKLVSTPLYRLVKGYVSIGIVFNLIAMTIHLVLNTYGDPLSYALLLMAPLIIVFFVSPGVVLLEVKQQLFKNKMVLILEKLGFNKRIEVTVNLKP